MNGADQRQAELLATLREIIDLSNQALRTGTISSNTLRAAALMQIRGRALAAIEKPGETDGNASSK